MTKLLLIANPAASGFTGGLHRDVMRILSAACDVDAVWPTSPGQVEELAGAAVETDVDLVVAFGGDGVVHHVACRLAGTSAALGIIPAGTTNVLARILGLPGRPKAAARYLASHPDVVAVPLARIRATSRGAVVDTHATFATGVGFDADVVAAADQEPYRKYRFGSLHYARTAGAVVLKRSYRRLPNLRVSDGRHEMDAVSVLVQIHEPYTFFGRVPLSVTREPREGLAVLVMERLAVWRVPSILRRAVRGAKLETIPGLTVWPDCREIVVYAEPPSPLQADGELLGLVSEVTISAASDRLWVAAPRPQSSVSQDGGQ
jgi:diacylglycerol kinase family enzyme